MSISNLDPELQPILEAFLSTGTQFDAEHVAAMRVGLRAVLDATPLARPPSVLVDDVTVGGAASRPEVKLRIYRPGSPSRVPALYWMHGGGMVSGSFDMEDELHVETVQELGLAVVSVDYRLAPEHPDPAPIEDCYTGLVWLASHAADYGLDPDRLAVGGRSAGAGLAAGTALLARDRKGPLLAFQLLLAPMLDDRAITPSSTAYEGSVIWDRHANSFGWTALLGDRVGTNNVSPYAAPARATDLAGLPPAFVDVGEVETFRDECIEYAQRLMIAGVSSELHVYPGVFHGSDVIAPDATVSRLARSLRSAALVRALSLELNGR